MIDCTLDSVILIDALRSRPTALARIAEFKGIGLSHVAFGEVLVGAFRRSDSIELSKISRMVSGMTILNGDETTSAIYAQIRSDLERRGAMIPQNDIWIAATAIQAGVPLLTRDNHFAAIPNLTIASY